MEICMSQIFPIENLWPQDLFSVSLCLILLLLLLLLLRNKSCGNNSNNLKLPPSPPKLPLIGNLHQLGNNLHCSLKTLSDKYGPLMHLNLGQVPAVVVSSPEILREMVENHDIDFSCRAQTIASEILFYNNDDFVFAPYGEYWRQARRVCVQELLSLRRVQSFQFVREEECGVLVNRIREACDRRKPINLSEMITLASNSIVCRCVLGQSYNNEDGSAKLLGELSSEISMSLVAFAMGDFFPSFRLVDVLTGFVGRLRKTFKAFDNFSEHVVEERKAKRKAIGLEFHAKDFVDVLLGLQNDARNDFEITQDHIKAILQDILVAGNESTGSNLNWLMAELVRNPRVMKKAQEEVRRVVGKKSKVEVDDVNRMDYLKCVSKETLRLHPGATVIPPRETTKNINIAGYEIPSKTRILVKAWAIQSDPSYWDRPEEFYPERFENNGVDINGQDYKFIPFGYGRRGCPGSATALVQSEYLAANLLYWFDWKLPSDCGILPEDLDMTELCGLSVSRKNPLHVEAIPYFP